MLFELLFEDWRHALILLQLVDAVGSRVLKVGSIVVGGLRYNVKTAILLARRRG